MAAAMYPVLWDPPAPARTTRPKWDDKIHQPAKPHVCDARGVDVAPGGKALLFGDQIERFVGSVLPADWGGKGAPDDESRDVQGYLGESGPTFKVGTLKGEIAERLKAEHWRKTSN